MRYIVNRYYRMIGYRDRPYGLSNVYTGETCFFSRGEYELIRSCDGTQEIDLQTLKPEEKEFMEWLLAKYFLRPCAEEETLEESQKYRFYDNRFRENVHWSITGFCNCRCRHCFMSAPHAKYRQLSFAECLKILDQLERCGVRKIGLTGGEPLCHPDFLRIVDEIAKRKMVLSTLYTNGLLLSDEVLSFLQARMQSPDIQISFDGRNTHDWMRGITGAEEAAVQAIRRSVEHGFMTHISMMLFRDNRDALMENLRFLDSLGVNSIKVTEVDDLGEWKAYAPSHGLSREEVWETYLSVIPELMKTPPEGCGGTRRFLPMPSGKRSAEKCF